MKTTQGTLAVILSCLVASMAHGQNTLQFTAIKATDESAIRLSWSSMSNEVYEVDEADSLIDTNTGTITWNKLYDNYPSQGTNTFWLDTGNYSLSPQILHPKYMPTRFYRVVDLGPDTTSDKPTVSITSPSSGSAATGELTVTVIASTDQPFLSGTKLYVDGQEMLPAATTTNYTDDTGVTNYEVDTYNINTCEWYNETHTLFATAECQSGFGDAPNTGFAAAGHGVSPFVSVLFSNLVQEISFSQTSFDPSSGQTQQVGAVFAANCNWTLTVQDLFSNVVKTATGSGTSLQYNWDGTSDAGPSVPTGIYYYYISAQTNGQSSRSQVSGGSGTDSGGAPSPSSVSSISGPDSETQLYAMPADGSGSAVPFRIYPPGVDTNGLDIFEASPADMDTLAALDAASTDTSDAPAAAGGAAGAGGSSASSQNTPAAPQRQPSNPTVGVGGIFGLAYDTFTANGTNVMTAPTIPNQPGIPGSFIALNGYSGSTHLTYAPLPFFKTEGGNFLFAMQQGGWRNTLLKVDGTLSINDLIGSGTPFNNVSIGVYMSHGSYGTTQDYQAGLCKQMYFPVTAGNSIQYLRMSQMNLGGSDPTNGLKWFVIMACDSLHQANWNSMQNMGVYPYNGNLHLLMGANSIVSTSSGILEYWATYMTFGVNNKPLTVHDAYFAAAHYGYQGHTFGNTMFMAVAGDSACFNDYIQQGSNSPPQGTWTYESRQVWP